MRTAIEKEVSRYEESILHIGLGFAVRHVSGEKPCSHACVMNDRFDRHRDGNYWQLLAGMDSQTDKSSRPT